MSDIIDLEVDESSIIPLEEESSGVVPLDVSETFVNVGANLQANKNASPAASQVIVTPDPGYDAMEKVTIEAMPQGALSPIDIDFDDDTGAFTASARVGTSGYIPDTAFVGGGFQLATQAAAAITPTNVQRQAVAAHKYTTGAVVVDPIPSEYIIPTGTKNITANGNAQDVKAYEKVNVSVPNSYSASDEGKVVSSGALVAQTSDTVTQNGVVDTTLINSLTVNVSGGGGQSITLLASGTYTKTDYATKPSYMTIPLSVSGTIAYAYVIANNPIADTNQTCGWFGFFDIPQVAKIPANIISANSAVRYTNTNTYTLANAACELTDGGSSIYCMRINSGNPVYDNTYTWYVWGYAS